MKDVSFKFSTLRTAVARATLHLSPETVTMIREQRVPKGDPLEVAKVAAIQAAKETFRIIPYCHPLPIEFVGVSYDVAEAVITADVEVTAVARTGVEMEAMTGAATAVLTLYDMMKMLDDAMSIGEVVLLKKRGGKSDHRRGDLGAGRRAAVLVMSDSISAGKGEDRSGRLIAERLESEGLEVVDFAIVPDDAEQIAARLRRWADEDHLDLVMTTGGTGFGPRDVTPEAMDQVFEREAPGIVETARAYGQDRVPQSMLSRGRAGIRGKTLIVNLPGSRGGVSDSLAALLPGMFHAFGMIAGGGHDDPPSD